MDRLENPTTTWGEVMPLTQRLLQLFDEHQSQILNESQLDHYTVSIQGSTWSGTTLYSPSQTPSSVTYLHDSILGDENDYYDLYFDDDMWSDSDASESSSATWYTIDSNEESFVSSSSWVTATSDGDGDLEPVLRRIDAISHLNELLALRPAYTYFQLGEWFDELELEENREDGEEEDGEDEDWEDEDGEEEDGDEEDVLSAILHGLDVRITDTVESACNLADWILRVFEELGYF